MSSAQWWGVGLGGLLAFWMLGAHNRIVALRNTILIAWGQAEAQFQQRAQAMSQLVESLGARLQAEAGTLQSAREALAALATACDGAQHHPASQAAVAQVARCDAVLVPMVARVTALAEAMPPGDAQLAPLLQRLRVLDESLRFARQRFNDAVAAYNAAVRQWPTRLLAPLFRFERAGPL